MSEPTDDDDDFVGEGYYKTCGYCGADIMKKHTNLCDACEEKEDLYNNPNYKQMRWYHDEQLEKRNLVECPSCYAWLDKEKLWHIGGKKYDYKKEVFSAKEVREAIETAVLSLITIMREEWGDEDEYLEGANDLNGLWEGNKEHILMDYTD